MTDETTPEAGQADERCTDSETTVAESDAARQASDGLKAENRALRERVEELEAALADIQQRLDESEDPADGGGQQEGGDEIDPAGDTDGEPAPVIATSGGQPTKVIGKLTDADGIGVLGDAGGSGATIGVKGTVAPGSDGYGLLTPNDARIEGLLDTGETDFVVETGTTNSEIAQNVLMGHEGNEVTSGAKAATISGGGWDDGDSNTTTSLNKVHSNYATVGGGLENEAGDPNTTDDPVPGASATVAGGSSNTASESDSTVGGGFENDATADSATVVGGYNNVASGQYATVLGGRDNVASGQYSIAAGRDAEAPNEGQVVFTDSNGVNPNTSISDRFHGRFDGGYRLETDASNDLTGVYLANGDGSWSSLSDPETKTNIKSVDGKSVLDGVADLDLSRWSYEWQTDIDHIGPMAGDLYEKFGVGRDDRGIQTIDAFGVLFAAVQGLVERVEQLEATTTDESESSGY